MSRVAFTVLGEPQPQGSKTTVVRKGKRPVMRDDNPGTKPWRSLVAAAALETMRGRSPLTGPLELHAVFVFARPAGHYGTGRNHGTLKASAPAYRWTRPDLDKLLRAIGDAMTGIVYRDDARIVIVRAEKHYGDGAAYAHISVSEIDEPAAGG